MEKTQSNQDVMRFPVYADKQIEGDYHVGCDYGVAYPVFKMNVENQRLAEALYKLIDNDYRECEATQERAGNPMDHKHIGVQVGWLEKDGNFLGLDGE